MMRQELHNDDCFNILRNMPDNYVQAVITDPPYGIDMDYGEGYNDTFENWCGLIDKLIPEAVRVASGPVFVPTSKMEGETYLHEHFPPKWRICWYKGSLSTRSPVGFKDWEQIFVYGDKIYGPAHDFFHIVPNIQKKYNHPCPKPIEWAKWFIKRFTKEGDLVLDPFMGTGTVPLACKMMDRGYIGIDLNRDFYEIAVKRLKYEGNQKNLQFGLDK